MVELALMRCTLPSPTPATFTKLGNLSTSMPTRALPDVSLLDESRNVQVLGSKRA